MSPETGTTFAGTSATSSSEARSTVASPALPSFAPAHTELAGYTQPAFTRSDFSPPGHGIGGGMPLDSSRNGSFFLSPDSALPASHDSHSVSQNAHLTPGEIAKLSQINPRAEQLNEPTYRPEASITHDDIDPKTAATLLNALTILGYAQPVPELPKVEAALDAPQVQKSEGEGPEKNETGKRPEISSTRRAGVIPEIAQSEGIESSDAQSEDAQEEKEEDENVKAGREEDSEEIKDEEKKQERTEDEEDEEKEIFVKDEEANENRRQAILEVGEEILEEHNVIERSILIQRVLERMNTDTRRQISEILPDTKRASQDGSVYHLLTELSQETYATLEELESEIQRLIEKHTAVAYQERGAQEVTQRDAIKVRQEGSDSVPV